MARNVARSLFELGTLGFALAGCAKPLVASHQASDASAPALPPGCAIEVDPSTTLPAGYVDVGQVKASCDGSRIAEMECMRALEDEACTLGADRLYWVRDAAKTEGRRMLLGQAARSASTK